MPVSPSPSPCPERTPRPTPRGPAPAGRLLAARLGLGLALALLLAGCSDRPRSNPLDPNNPDTGGGPTGFTAVAADAQVALHWNAAPERAELLGFRLERRRAGPNAWEIVADSVALASTGLLDAVANDLEYEYRLSYLARAGGTVGTPALAQARAGREVIWVSDPSLDEVVRVTPDGRTRVLTIGGVRIVNRIAVDVGTGNVWATEPFDGHCKVFSPTGTLLSDFAPYAGPNAVAYDPLSATAWVCDENSGAIGRFTLGGAQVAADTLDAPDDIAVTGGSDAWVLDTARGWIVRYVSTGLPRDTVEIGAGPRRLAVDTLDGSVWVTLPGSGEVVKVSAGGTILFRASGLTGVFAVDLDELRNRAWVTLPQSGQVLGLSRGTGAVEVRVDGVGFGSGISVADRTGEVFVSTYRDHQLVRISSDGAVAGRLDGFEAPYEVQVDPGPRALPGAPPAAPTGAAAR